MAVTIDQLLDELNAFQAARDAAAAAHTATIAATNNVLTVTTVEQGKIDAAVAQFDIATTQAAQEKADAEAAEVAANVTETTAFEQLVMSLTAFKDEQ